MHICGGAHDPGQCIAQEDSSREVNYMGAQNRHRFQGYNQRGLSRFNQGRNFTQGSSWRIHLGNQFNKEQRSQHVQNSNQGIDLYEKTNKLEEALINSSRYPYPTIGVQSYPSRTYRYKWDN